MPSKEWTKSIKGADDVELGIPRASPLIYHCAAPESGKANGLVFVIPGFGEDASGEDQHGLRAYLAERYGLLAVTVEYHCYRSRPLTGATLTFTEGEFRNFCALCAKHDISVASPLDVKDALLRLPRPYLFDLRLTPPNGDYQNFGVMQALDHLLVLADLRKPGGVAFDEANIVAFGSSHGGYIAHMIAKFAPNTLRGVIDNSSYTAPIFSNPDGKLLFSPSLMVGYKLSRVDFYLETRWTKEDKAASAYYSDGRHAIRDLALPNHIQAARAASRRPCQYRMMHSVEDNVQPIEGKRQQAESLRAAGFDVALKEVTAKDIDGRMIKNLEHGMDASMRALFDHFYPTLQPSPGQLDTDLGTDVAYLCGDMIYSFGHGQWGCQMHVEHMRADRPSYNFPRENWGIPSWTSRRPG